MIERPKAQFLNRQTQPHMATLILMVSISALAMNIFLPSLPRMADEFGTSAAILGLSERVSGGQRTGSVILRAALGYAGAPSSDALVDCPVHGGQHRHYFLSKHRVIFDFARNPICHRKRFCDLARHRARHHRYRKFGLSDRLYHDGYGAGADVRASFGRGD